MRRRISFFVTLAIILLAGSACASASVAAAATTATTAVLPDHHRACQNWKAITSPDQGTGSNFLNGIATVAGGDVWAVGSYSNGSGSQPLIMRRSKGSWTIVSSPAVAGSLSGIAALSANNIWAVGENDSSNQQETLIEHWDGKTWQIIPSPDFATTGNMLAAISIDSAADIWAAGTTTSSSSSSGYQPLIEHWNGTQWSLSSSPALSGRLFGVVAINPNDAWAVGDNIMPNIIDSLIEHWDGKQWSLVSSPNPSVASNILNAVVKVTGTDIWAAGDSSNSVGPSADYSPLIEQWNGSKWSVVDSPVQGTSDQVNGMAEASTSNITVVGDYRTGLDPMGPYYTLVEHWNGTKWSVVTSPSPGTDASDLMAAAYIPGSNIAWAAGITYNGVTYQTLTEKSC
jgi:hypothetical protein